MTDLDLQAIKDRLDAVPDGPWYVSGFGFVCRRKPAAALIADNDIDLNLAQFIAHARTDIPALLAEVDRLRTTDKDG